MAFVAYGVQRSLRAALIAWWHDERERRDDWAAGRARLSGHLVYSVYFVSLVCLVRRYLRRPEIIMAVLLAWVYVSLNCF